MKRTILLPLAALSIILPTRAAWADHELTLAEAVSMAEANSPRLRAGGFQEKAAHEGIGAARAGYYPSLSAQGIDSWGFPGSSGYLGVGGLMGSPFRSGMAGGVVARDTLFDFGRTYATVRAAESAEKAQKAGTESDRYALDLDVLQTFYECSRYRSEHAVWDSLHGETELVAKEVTRFVNVGQRSVVDRYLSEAQVEEARTNRNYFKSRMTSAAARLGLLMGSAEKDLACPALPAPGAAVPLAPTYAPNPFLLRAQTEVEAASNRLFQAKTDYLPKVVGVASMGAAERMRLLSNKDHKDYSGGLGVVLPLFDGLGTQARVAQARAELDARAQDLSAVRLQLDELKARYDEVIDASKARIEHLEREQKLAEEGFAVAKNRYFKFQGTLVDLRDALRNIGRIETEMSDTQANLLEAAGAKALLEGAAPADGAGRKP